MNNLILPTPMWILVCLYFFSFGIFVGLLIFRVIQDKKVYQDSKEKNDINNP